MGYYTSFELTVIPADIQGAVEDFIELIDATDYTSPAAQLKDGFSYALTPSGNPGHWYPNESCKWYEHDEDMKYLSTRFPGVVFELSGSGEENGDIWRSWYKDGKSYDWHMPQTYGPSYDEIKDKLA